MIGVPFKICNRLNMDTGEKIGEATVTYDDVTTAQRSISWFDGKDFDGHTTNVQMPSPSQKKKIVRKSASF